MRVAEETSISEQEQMWLMFLEIWNNTTWKDRVCYETGEHIYGEPLTIYFHHILEKEKYPQYTLCKWNIVLVTFHTHQQVHMNIDKCPKIKQLRLELLEKHHNFEL